MAASKKKRVEEEMEDEEFDVECDPDESEDDSENDEEAMDQVKFSNEIFILAKHKFVPYLK